MIKNQFELMPERLTIETIYLLRQLNEKYLKNKQDLYIIFIDLKNFMTESKIKICREF